MPDGGSVRNAERVNPAWNFTTEQVQRVYIRPDSRHCAQKLIGLCRRGKLWRRAS